MNKNIFKSEKILKIAGRVLRWHIHYYLFFSGFPLIAGIFTTTRCNMRCKMCSIWQHTSKEDISLEEVKQILNSIGRGLCYLSLSGGEPLLVKDIVEMVSITAQKIPYVHMVSNGSLLDKNMALELQEAGLSELSISIDGDEKFHNRIRGYDNAFQKAIAAIENMRNFAPRVKLTINSVIFPQATDQIEHVLKIAEEKKINMKVQPCSRHFDFKNVTKERMDCDWIEDKQNGKICQLLKKLKKSKRIINSVFYLDHLSKLGNPQIVNPLIRKQCLIADFFIELNSNGYLSGCMQGSGWEERAILFRGRGINNVMKSCEYKNMKNELTHCKKCDKSMYICYWEPMATFPVHNFLKYSLLYKGCANGKM